MWFGDLVTMGWWNGIWLNEAFATYMALRCLDDFKPSTSAGSGSAATGRSPSPSTGSTRHGRSNSRCERPTRSTRCSTCLTYEKGGSLLRMLEQYLGTERFREGVRRYLAAHRYGNTETTDLWDAIEKAAEGLPIRASWTRGSSRAGIRS